MGSADLLQLVKSVHQPVHIKEYAGKTVAVDGRRGSVVWHSLVSSDSVHGVVDNGGDKNTNISTITPLSTDSTNNDDDDRDKNDDNNNNNNNDKTDKNDDDDDDDNHDNDETLNDNESAKGALLQQLDILRSYDVTPLVVVEGNVLPCDKKKTKGGKSDDHENMDSGNDNEKTMQEQKDAFLKHLDKEKIEYIQAPFESGAQLAYLIETKRVEAALFVDTNEASSSAGDGIAFGCQVTLFGLQSDGSATRVRLSDLTCGGANKEIELRDWSLKSVGELCLMCDCANVQVERAHSLFVKHKKNMRLALQEAVDKRKDVETIYKRMVYRWSQKVYDDKLRRNVSWHKDAIIGQKDGKDHPTASGQQGKHSPLAKSDNTRSHEPSNPSRQSRTTPAGTKSHRCRANHQNRCCTFGC
ncbi:hypothetical protein BDB00DRAFT_633080 [Zychaea mexicana]|uniref:uncharacterized protein n=1 Tax=Zychaea mexicana TaxID=64656 RepID=UPI0022FDDFB8|nr:uncharacterized protein BDB00DRAFT_633080 [Zychaea mexicana]KAI9489226.1 hypothetical protein BDB00DRAFT_633080 [Zychaea mexicana]